MTDVASFYIYFISFQPKITIIDPIIVIRKGKGLLVVHLTVCTYEKPVNLPSVLSYLNKLD